MRAARGWFAQVRAKPPCFMTLVFYSSSSKLPLCLRTSGHGTASTQALTHRAVGHNECLQKVRLDDEEAELTASLLALLLLLLLLAVLRAALLAFLHVLRVLLAFIDLDRALLDVTEAAAVGFGRRRCSL